jgi:hypothetical protein
MKSPDQFLPSTFFFSIVILLGLISPVRGRGDVGVARIIKSSAVAYDNSQWDKTSIELRVDKISRFCSRRLSSF